MRTRFAGAVVAAAIGCGATPALSQCTVGQLLELKVTMKGTRPMVPVTLDGHDEQMLVDSGAFFSTIPAAKATELGLRREALPPRFHVRGIGGEVDASQTTIKSVKLAGLDLRNIPFIVGGGGVGGGAGLLGQNVLGIGDVEYDLGHGAIRLMRPHDCKGTNMAYWAAGRAVSEVTIDARDAGHPHTVGTIFINGVKMRATFDTGASGTVLSLAAAAKIGLKPDSPGVRAIGYSFGIGRKSVADYLIPIDTIKLGDGEEIRRTHLRAEALGLDDTDLLIGADFFRSHRVYVANALHRLFFTYEGGPIFGTTAGPQIDTEGNTVAAAADTVAEPTDAAGYSRRGAAAMARRDYARALADFDKACAMAPTTSAYFFQRAQARAASRQPLMAMDDLDQTLKLDPANAEARLARASIRLGRHDRAAAEEDVATVEAAAAPAADARLTLAQMYDGLGERAKAVAQFDLWLRYHADDARKPVALNGRCWARAQLGTDLAKALSDCNAAIKARPGIGGYIDSRGLVRLRMGDNAGAIGDYDAALAIQPKLVWALYGRGLAKQRSGDKPGGDQDRAAAVALDAGIAGRAQAIGLGG